METGFYVVLAYWDVTEQKLVYLETIEGAKDFLEALIGKDLIMQNAPFDCAMTFNNFQVELMPYVHTDTLALGHLLNENRQNGLKERGVELFGEDAVKEQIEMKESVHRNGGVLTKNQYELYKADADLIAYYGAKDAILTLKIFYHDVPILFEEGLDKFFYEEETMPLLRGPTYHLNTSGLRVDPNALQVLKKTLEAECLEAKAFIHKEIHSYVKDKYPGTGKTNHFNINATQQRAWLLFTVLGNEFVTLTESGREMCKALDLKPPYSPGAKREFIRVCEQNKGRIWAKEAYNPKTKKMGRPKKVGDPWQYMSAGKVSLGRYAAKYKWVERLLEYAKNLKLLNTYVEGIESRLCYNVIRPSFLQHGTTSGRYSCKNPNFQNLPRDDKRIKSCIVSRPGMVFVGADYAQLEPRVFASQSKDWRLMECFRKGEDFYSVIGMEVFEKYDCSLIKSDKNSFAKKHPVLRDISKVVGLSSTYGTTAFRMAPTIGKTTQEAQEVIDSYFDKFPDVYKFMLDSHTEAKKNGRVCNLFGRPRRMPEALNITKRFGNTPHAELPYEIRNILNLAVNHRVQSTAASLMNRAAVAVYDKIQQKGWNDVKIVLQIHDELVLEGPEALAEEMSLVLKEAMENTCELPGVDLVAEPKVAYSLGDLK